MTTQPSTDLEQRVSRLEGAYEQVTERLGDLSQAIAGLRADMHTEIGSLRAETNTRFNTLLLMIAGLWATMIGGFIALFVNG